MKKNKLKEVLIRRLQIISAKSLIVLPIVLISSGFRKLDIYSVLIGIIIGYACEQAEDFIKDYFYKKGIFKGKDVYINCFPTTANDKNKKSKNQKLKVNPISERKKRKKREMLGLKTNYHSILEPILTKIGNIVYIKKGFEEKALKYLNLFGLQIIIKEDL